MVESTGWDTHANQVGPYGVLNRNLAALDKGVDALATGLGPHWTTTAVLIVTEFGRTVAMNGTGGTDHGTASAAFLVGRRGRRRPGDRRLAGAEARQPLRRPRPAPRPPTCAR